MIRAVLGTNVLLSALISPSGHPATIYNAWQDGAFTLLCSAELLEELHDTLQNPRVAALIKPYHAGRLVNQIRKLAAIVAPVPPVKRSPDPKDDFLLALAEAGHADYLVTGDKAGLLSLRRHKSTTILSPAAFAAFFA